MDGPKAWRTFYNDDTSRNPDSKIDEKILCLTGSWIDKNHALLKSKLYFQQFSLPTCRGISVENVGVGMSWVRCPGVRIPKSAESVTSIVWTFVSSPSQMNLNYSVALENLFSSLCSNNRLVAYCLIDEKE